MAAVAAVAGSLHHRSTVLPFPPENSETVLVALTATLIVEVALALERVNTVYAARASSPVNLPQPVEPELARGVWERPTITVIGDSRLVELGVFEATRPAQSARESERTT